MASVKTRQCSGCGEHSDGRDMFRIVRTPDGEVRYDATGRCSGRGMYVCKKKECIEKAFKRAGIGRGLHVEIDPTSAMDLKNQLLEELTDGEA